MTKNRKNLVGCILIGLLSANMLQAMIAEDLLIQPQSDSFMLLHKELGPPELKADATIVLEGRRRGESKYFRAHVHEDNDYTSLNEIRVKQNFLCLHKGNSWIVIDYDKQREFGYELHCDAVVHAVVDGDNLILFHDKHYRVFSLLKGIEIYEGSVTGEIRGCREGKIFCYSNGTVRIMNLIDGEVISETEMSDMNYDIAMNSLGTVIARGFTMHITERDKGGKDYTRINKNVFKIWHDDNAPCEKLVAAPPKGYPSYKLFIIDDSTITLNHTHADAPMGEDRGMVRQLSVRDGRGVLLRTFDFPNRWKSKSLKLSKAAICVDGNMMVVSMDDAIHLCDLKTGDMRSLPHKGAYLCSLGTRKIISGSRKGTVSIWDRHRGERLATFTGVSALKKMVKANFFNVHADGKQLVIGRTKGVTLKYSVVTMPISLIEDCNALRENNVSDLLVLAKSCKNDKQRKKLWKEILQKIYS